MPSRYCFWAATYKELQGIDVYLFVVFDTDRKNKNISINKFQ